MLKKILVFNLLMILAAVAFTACGGGATNTATNTAANKPAENKAATNTATETKPANTATENKAAENKSTASTGGDIGVPECDEYIKKVEACITSKVPEAQRGAFKTAFETSRANFKQQASNPQTKAGLATGCKAALDAAKQSYAAFSCEW